MTGKVRTCPNACLLSHLADDNGGLGLTTYFYKGFVLKKRSALVCAVLAATLCMQGCSTWKDSLKTSKRVYKEYINVDPTIDLEKQDYSTDEEKLSVLFSPVDKNLEKLTIHLNRQDTVPSEKWIEGLFSTYPWISGVLACDLEGNLVMQRPDAGMKPINIAPLLAEDPEEYRSRSLRAYVDETPLGPEVYVATPLFRGNDPVGLLAIHFDLRKLLEFCPEPQNLMVFTPAQVLWAGAHKGLTQQLLAQDWENILKEDVSGTMDIEEQEVLWLVRRIAGTQILYAVEAASGE